MPYTIDGTSVQLSHEPQIKDGTMWVPFREIAEAMGAKVEFEPDTRAPMLFLGDHMVTLVEGQRHFDVNGQQMLMQAAPFIEDGETFVPVRLFENIPGVQMNVDIDSKQVDLMTSVTETSTGETPV